MHADSVTGAPDGHRPRPSLEAEGERRRRDPGRAAGRAEVTRRASAVRRLPGPDPRGRHEGPLHQAALRGCRSLRRLPRAAASGSTTTRSTSFASPGCSTTSARSAIPDHILRKPGRSATPSTQIVKQHVALGDLIVRDLPDVDQIRAGVRHHHERWDGARLSRPPGRRGDPARRPDPGASAMPSRR